MRRRRVGKATLIFEALDSRGVLLLYFYLTAYDFNDDVVEHRLTQIAEIFELPRNRTGRRSPDLQLRDGWCPLSHIGRNRPFPMAISDTEPDRWSRQVFARAFRQAGFKGRRISDLDYLLGVDDYSRVSGL